MCKMVEIESRSCPECGQSTFITVSEDGYEAWISGLKRMSEAMPNLTDDDRERLMSGLHGDCWQNYLGPEEDEVYGFDYDESDTYEGEFDCF